MVCRGSLAGMDHTHLGRSGLSVSRLCLGTMNFGPQTPEADAHAIMDAAHEYGINFFDTANRYGGDLGAGATESILGRWFAHGGGRREKTVLATKLYGAMGDWPNDGKLSALHIRRALDASLQRLQTDYVDLYQFHHVDRDTPWDEIWQAMEVAVAQGKILYAGSSNFAGWHIATAQERAKARNFTGLVSEQSIYNLLKRDIELEVIPAASDRHRDHPVVAAAGRAPRRRRPQGARGRAPARGPREGVAREAPRRDRGVRGPRAELGHEPGDVALAWLLHQPAVTAPIIGPRTREQLDAAVRALDVTLDDAVLARLDEIFPGHRTAPEDYAW